MAPAQCQNDPLTTKFECLAIAKSPNEIISPFVQLPGELILTILEYAHEAIRELRLTCRVLQYRVDEFVRQPIRFPLVHKINMQHYHDYDDDEDRMNIVIYVPLQNVALFELRRKYLSHELLTNSTNRKACNRLKRWVNEKCESDEHTNCYSLNIPPLDCVRYEWNFLMESMGQRVTRVLLPSSSVGNQFPTECKHIEELHFKELTLYINTITESVKKTLIETIKTHKIECMSLCLTGRAPETPQVDFLLELSSLLHSLHIRGCFPSPYMRPFEWAPLIIQMLSRRLDKLHIEPPLWEECLTREGADYLIEHLPMIGKKVWFKATFRRSTTGRSNIIKNHVIHESSQRRRNKSNWVPTLSIIHKSRQKEQSPRGN